MDNMRNIIDSRMDGISHPELSWTSRIGVIQIVSYHKYCI